MIFTEIFLGVVFIFLALLCLFGLMTGDFKDGALLAFVLFGAIGVVLFVVGIQDSGNQLNKEHNTIYHGLIKSGYSLRTNQVYAEGNRFRAREVDLNEGKCNFPLRVKELGNKWVVYVPSSVVGGADYILTPNRVKLLANVCL